MTIFKVLSRQAPARRMRGLRARVAVSVGLIAVLGGLGVAVSGASAAEPWWHVNTISAPASFAAGEGTVVVEVSNLGDARVEAIGHPVTIVDQLPAGVTPVSPEGEEPTVVPEGEYNTSTGQQNSTHIECAFAGQTVTCTFSGSYLSGYEHLLIAIKVRFASASGRGVNEVSVSGGANVSGGSVAPVTPFVSRRALALGDSPLPFGVESYEMTPEEEGGAADTQAGSHPFQLTTTFNFNTHMVLNQRGEGKAKLFQEVEPIGPFTKDLHFNLPAGLVGNPTPIPRCSMKVFVEEPSAGRPKCPLDTVVGATAVTYTGSKITVPAVFTGAVFNLEPSQGEPARFGFQTPAGPVILDTSVRTGSGYGVVVTVPDITQGVEFIGSQLTFWGVPSDPRHDTTRGQQCLINQILSFTESSCPGAGTGQPFLIMPTSCTGPLETSLEADSWEQPGQFTAPREYAFQNSVGEPVAQDGCNHLNFEPSISASPDGQEGSTPTGLSVGVHVPQDASLNPKGLAESTVREVTVALPAGIAVNPAAGDGLLACGLGEIALDSAEEQTCPEASKVATVEIKTPLLPNPLVGALYLAAQDANPFGSLIALYIVARDPVSGVLVKLPGEVKPDAVTGQLVTTFKVPQLPFEDGTFHFFGGSRAPLGTPASCGSYTTTASIAPWSGNAPVDSSSEFLITSGPNHSPCASPLPFAPSLTTGSLNIQAGAFTPFTTTLSRGDGQQTLQGVQLHLPGGLTGLLTGVKLCGEAEANAGTCGPESLIGETTVSVGLGSNPFSVKGGRVYITGPHDGAPFGLSIVNPAKAGPYDLEKETACDCVVVRAKIEVDPHTAALTITTDDTGPYKIPTILQGIPLQIQHVNVTISREHFTFNPTNCSKTAITGTLLSTEGATSALSIPFQVTNCATLKFAPKFSVSTSGKTSRAKGASLAVKLTYPKAPFGSQANISRVKVDLPKQLPSRLTTLQKACTAAQFEANPAGCPAASLIGHGKAITPLIPVALEGPAYFVSHGGEAFPSLIIVLQGYGVTLDLVGSTFISHTGITSSTFKTVPDAPVGSFELTLPEGKYSALAANGNLCKSKLVMPTAFVGQNGAEIHESTKIAVTGCPTAKKATKKKHKTKGKGKGKARKK